MIEGTVLKLNFIFHRIMAMLEYLCPRWVWTRQQTAMYDCLYDRETLNES